MMGRVVAVDDIRMMTVMGSRDMEMLRRQERQAQHTQRCQTGHDSPHAAIRAHDEIMTDGLNGGQKAFRSMTKNSEILQDSAGPAKRVGKTRTKSITTVQRPAQSKSA